MPIINGIIFGGGGEPTNGLPADLLSGKKLNNEDGDSVVGTMPNNGAVGGTITQQAGKVIIPAGYTSGGQVEANIANLTAANIKQGTNVGGVAGNFTSDANAVAGDVLTTKTAYVQGSKVTGSMANRGAITQTISTQGGQYTVPAGYHSGSGKVTASFANLVAENVRSGVNIGGIVGNLMPGFFATGTITMNNKAFPALNVGFAPILGIYYATPSSRAIVIHSRAEVARHTSGYKLYSCCFTTSAYFQPVYETEDNGPIQTTCLNETGVRAFYHGTLSNSTLTYILVG